MKATFNYSVKLSGKTIEQGQISARSAGRAQKMIEDYVKMIHGFNAYVNSHISVQEV